MDTIRIFEALHNLFYAPLYVTQALDLFEKEDIEVQVRTRQAGEDVLGMLREERADIALTGPMRTLVAADGGQRDLPLSFIEVNSRDGFMLLSRQPRPEFEWRELEGATVVTYREPPTPWMCLMGVLRSAGVDPGRVKFSLDRPIPEAIEAFNAGHGDFIQLPEPQAGEMLAAGGCYLVTAMGRFAGAIPYTAYAATPEYLDRQQDLALRFTRAVFAGQRWMEANSAAEIAALAAGALAPTPLAVLIEGAERYKSQSTWAADPLLRRDSFDHFQGILRDGGLIKNLHSYDELVTTRFADAVMAENTRRA